MENTKRILMIHDRASIWEPLAQALAGDGYLVVPICRSALARDMILALRPDLVLLDWNIDEKDRGQVFEEVRKQAPGLRLLALAAAAHPPQGSGTFSADVYVLKGPGLDGLRQKVAAVLPREYSRPRGKLKSDHHPT